MADMESRDQEIDKLIREIADIRARLGLLEFREQTEAVLDEIRGIRDELKETSEDFVRILKATGKILIARDRAIWEEIIHKMLNDRGQDARKRK